MEKPVQAGMKFFAATPLGRIASATLMVGVLTAVARSTTVAREIAAAGTFGTGDVLDAYLIAYAIPIYLLGAVGGAFQSAFVPRYIALRAKEGDEEADRLLGNAITAMVMGLGAVAVALVAVANFILPLMALSFGPEKLQLAQNLLYVMAPIVLLGAVPVVYSAWLNALERFRIPALLPGVGPLVAVSVLLLFSHAIGIYALAWGTLAGALCEALVVITAARMGGRRLPTPLLMPTDELRRVGEQFWPLLLGALLFSSTGLADQIMAASLADGSVAALGFGTRATALVIAVVGMGVRTAVLPTFSHMVAAREWEVLKRSLYQFGAIVVLGAAVISVGVALYSGPITELLFERGDFLQSDTELVAGVQVYFVLQLPFFLLSLILVRLLSALGMNRVVFALATFNTVLNIALNYVLMASMGVAGIALSTTLVHVLYTVLLVGVVAARLKRTAR